MDKLFDGGDAHLLPGNAELIRRLRARISGEQKSRVKLDNEAAAALEAADKRIAELERKYLDSVEVNTALQHGLYEKERKLAKLEAENAAQLTELHAISAAIGTAEGHSSVYHIEAMREKLAVAREAMQQTIEENGHLADGDVCTLKSLKEALAQIGGDDAG